MKMLRATFFGSIAAIICVMALLAVSAGVIVTKTHAATPLLSAADSPIVAGDPVVSARSKAPGPSGYHLLKKIPLGGEGFWDYITFDPATRRLYISRGSRVVVLEVDSGKTVGEIPNTDGVHGIALAPEFNRGFTSNGR